MKSEKPQIEMREVAGGELIWSVPSNVEPYGVAVSPDGKFVASSQRDGVHVLNAETGENVRLAKAYH